MIQNYCHGNNIYAGMINKDGKAKFSHEVDFFPLKFWESPESGAEYPIKWKILIKKWNVELIIDSLLKNSEIIFGSLNYWEGPISVKAVINSKKVNGNGFMELAGRTMKKTKLELYHQQLRKKAEDYISVAKKKTKIFLNKI